MASFVENINKLALVSDEIYEVINSVENINIVADNVADVNTVADNILNVNTVSSISDEVVIVANNIDSVITVSDNIENVNFVGNDLSGEFSYIEDNGSITDPVESYTSSSNIVTVADEIDNVVIVAENIDDIVSVAGGITDVSTLATITSDITTVAGISTDVSTVASNDSNITSVADNMASVIIAGTNISDIQTVADEVAKVIVVANDLNEAVSEIDVVATNIDSVNTVGTNISSINTVSSDIGSVSTVATSISDVVTVATDILDVSTVSSNISAVGTVANGISDVSIVSTNIVDVSTVAGISTDISTVASISSDITTVAGLSSDITFLATNWDDKVNTTDIGITVQPYDANTVVDSSYIHTDNNFSNTLKSKLDGISSGAEVNVNADWNATSGDEEILNKPTLGTASAQDVEDFATATQGSNADTAYGWGNHASVGYALDNAVVHDTGNETVGGIKTFTDGIVSSSIQLSGGTGTQGTVSWNTDEETLDLIQNGATLQLGQELQVHCRNNTASTIANGKVVMATGTLGASGRITISPYDGTTDIKYVVGIATEDIIAGDDGKITAFGKVRGIDTSAYNEGDILYPTTSGNLTATVPTSGIKNAIAIVINKHAVQGTLMVRFTPLNENAYVPISGDFTLDLGAL